MVFQNLGSGILRKGENDYITTDYLVKDTLEEEINTKKIKRALNLRNCYLKEIYRYIDQTSGYKIRGKFKATRNGVILTTLKF